VISELRIVPFVSADLPHSGIPHTTNIDLSDGIALANDEGSQAFLVKAGEALGGLNRLADFFR